MEYIDINIDSIAKVDNMSNLNNEEYYGEYLESRLLDSKYFVSITNSTICTREFFNYFKAKYPKEFASRNKKCNWRFLSYLLFSDNYYKDKEKVFTEEKDSKVTKSYLDVSAPIISAIRNDFDAIRNKEAVVRPFIEDMLKSFPNIIFSGHVPGKTRTLLLDRGLDADDRNMIRRNRKYILDLCKKDISKDEMSKQDLVYFVSGTKYQPKKKTKDEKIIEEIMDFKVKKLTEQDLLQDQKDVINYLNTRGERHYSMLYDDNLKRTIELYEKMKPELDYDVKRVTNIVLARKANNQPKKPFYSARPNAKSVRISPLGYAITSMKREFRKSLCAGLIELDMRSSQFAIISAKLKAKKCLDFIKSGENLWERLARDIGPECDLEKDKDIMKEFIYSVCFGMTRDNLRENYIIKANKPHFEKLFSNELIKELLDKRDKWIAEIGKDKKVLDQYKIERKMKFNHKLKRYEIDERSLAASVIQSIEFYIIKGVFDHAIVEEQKGNGKRYDILFFQHDGIMIKMNPAYDKEEQKGRHRRDVYNELSAIVRTRAAKLGVDTYLEYNELT